MFRLYYRLDTANIRKPEIRMLMKRDPEEVYKLLSFAGSGRDLSIHSIIGGTLMKLTGMWTGRNRGVSGLSSEKRGK